MVDPVPAPAQAPLIINKIESGMLTSMPRSRPDAVYVLSYGDGTLRRFDRAPGFADRTGSKYCFIVDRSQRFTSDMLRIPAQDSVHHFEISYDAAWQVTDPLAVVQANLGFGEPVVKGYMESSLWPVGRGFAAFDAKGAEAAANRTVRPPAILGTGLTLNGVTIRVSVDGTAQEQHDLGQKVDYLRGIVGDVDPFLLLHVAQNSGDTGGVLQMLNDSRDKDVQMKLAVLDRLIAAEIVTDADGDLLRGLVFGGTQSLSPGSWSPGPAGGRSVAPAVAPAIAPAATPSSVPAPGGWNVPALGSAPAPLAAIPAQSTPAVVTPPPVVHPAGFQDQRGPRPRAAAPDTATPAGADTPTVTAPAPRRIRPERPAERPGDEPAAAPSAPPRPANGVVGKRSLRRAPR